MELIKISFDKIMQTRTYTMVILGNDQKKFAIFTEPHVGNFIQDFFIGTKRARPSTYELMNMCFKGLEVIPKQIVIKDLQDTTYFAKLFIEQMVGELRHIVEIDARPSDCITLALMHNLPVYCTKEVMEKTVSVTD